MQNFEKRLDFTKLQVTKSLKVGTFLRHSVAYILTIALYSHDGLVQLYVLLKIRNAVSHVTKRRFVISTIILILAIIINVKVCSHNSLIYNKYYANFIHI